MNNNEIRFENGIPKKNYFIMFILYFKLLLLIPFFKFTIKRYMSNSDNITFTPGFTFFYGKNIFARNVQFTDTFLLDYAPIYIGDGTRFSFQNMVISGSHDLLNRDIVVAKPVFIGKNVWITSRCVILPGVTIGDNSVISAGSVVVNDIPPNCIAGGNPARVIKYLSPNK